MVFPCLTLAQTFVRSVRNASKGIALAQPDVPRGVLPLPHVSPRSTACSIPCFDSPRVNSSTGTGLGTIWGSARQSIEPSRGGPRTRRSATVRAAPNSEAAAGDDDLGARPGSAGRGRLTERSVLPTESARITRRPLRVSECNESPGGWRPVGLTSGVSPADPKARLVARVHDRYPHVISLDARARALQM